MSSNQSASWTDEMTSKFLEIMLEVKKASTASNGGFKKQEWQKIYNAFNSTCGLNYDVAQLQSKYSDLKKKYTTVHTLRSLSGFGWDPETKTVTADEDTWTRYLERHTEARQFKTKPFIFFDQMDELRSGSHATGGYATSSSAAEANSITTVSTITSDINTCSTNEEKIPNHSDDGSDDDADPTKQPPPLKKKAKLGFGSELLSVIKSWGPSPLVRTPISTPSSITASTTSNTNAEMNLISLTDVSLVRLQLEFFDY